MKLFINIGVLAGADPRTSARRGAEMNVFKTIEAAWLLTDGDTIAACGEMATLGEMPENAEIIDLDGRWVFPSFCDSHTHIIYAGERSGEFLDKINGLSYEEIARRGGGILNSADLLAATPEEDLYRQAMERIDEVISKGTGAIEIKSGYGLTTESELKMLRVARRIKETVPLEVKTTFLGAHAVGRAYAGRQSDYVDMLCRETIPEVGRQRLADYVDVFCDRGFFTPDETSRILEAAGAYGMRPKIHANELDISGGVQIGVAHGALSVDHLERIGEEEIRLLAHSGTIATALPGASFFLGMPYARTRELINAGAAVALASDYNPGSSPSGDMRFVASLGSIRMRLTPEQSLNATTINGAAAMGVAERCGTIAAGKNASFFITRPLPSLQYLLYAYTTPLITDIYLRGNRIKSKQTD